MGVWNQNVIAYLLMLSFKNFLDTQETA
jgi:hypothetical protein